MYNVYDSTGHKVGGKQPFATYTDALMYKCTFGNSGWYIKNAKN